MAQLRELRVVIAGHDLSAEQRALASWGSYLVVPPWRPNSTCPVAELGKLNMAFYIASCPMLTLVIQVCYLRMSSSGGCGPSERVIYFLFWFIMLMLWVWRCELDPGLMLAKNGQHVLRTMLRAATGQRQPPLDIDRLVHSLVWLPAHDRRDILTAKAVLENVASAVRGAPAADNTDAVAASVYYAALLNPAESGFVSDAIENRSAREWFAAVGITLYEGAQRMDHLSKEVSTSLKRELSSPRPETEMPVTDWLDTPPMPRESAEALVQPSEALEPDAERKRLQARLKEYEQAHMKSHDGRPPRTREEWGEAWPDFERYVELRRKHDAGESKAGAVASKHETDDGLGDRTMSGRIANRGPRSDASLASPEGSSRPNHRRNGSIRVAGGRLYSRKLQRLGWRIRAGVYDVVTTPAGEYYVPSRRYHSSAVEPVRSLRLLRRVPPIRFMMASITPTFVITVVAFSSFIIIKDVEQAYAGCRIEVRGCGASAALWWDLANATTNISSSIIALLLFGSYVADSVPVLRTGRVPQPFPASGRLEAFVAWFVLAALYGSQLSPYVGNQYFIINYTDLTWFVRMGLIFIVQIIFALLALIHSVAAAVRHRDLRYAFAILAARREARVHIL